MSGEQASARAGTDRRDLPAARAEVEQELARRDAALHELIHRTRNTMQTVGSLIALQAAALDDATARRAFDDTAGRVRAIALALEHPPRPGDLNAVALGSYLRALLNAAAGSLGMRGSVAASFHAEPAELPIARAVPLGLAVNEILANVYHHAFPDGRRGTLKLDARHAGNGRFAVTIADDGIGLPASIDLARARTLGLRLVWRLTRQAEAEVAVERGAGTLFRIEFAAEPRRRA